MLTYFSGLLSRSLCTRQRLEGFRQWLQQLYFCVEVRCSHVSPLVATLCRVSQKNQKGGLWRTACCTLSLASRKAERFHYYMKVHKQGTRFPPAPTKPKTRELLRRNECERERGLCANTSAWLSIRQLRHHCGMHGCCPAVTPDSSATVPNTRPLSRQDVYGRVEIGHTQPTYISRLEVQHASRSLVACRSGSAAGSGVHIPGVFRHSHRGIGTIGKQLPPSARL